MSEQIEHPSGVIVTCYCGEARAQMVQISVWHIGGVMTLEEAETFFEKSLRMIYDRKKRIGAETPSPVAPDPEGIPEGSHCKRLHSTREGA